MKKFMKLLMVFMVACTMFSSCGYERIDGGYEGVRVELYGSDKGVQDVSVVTGAVWYNTFTTSIFEFPMFNQRVIWTVSDTEGSENNDEFSMTTKDGLSVQFDVALNYKIKEGYSSVIYKEYRKDLDELNNTTIRDFLRGCYKRAIQSFTGEELYSKAAAFQMVSDSIIKATLDPKGFEVTDASIIGKIRIPQKIKNGIEAKVAEKQLTLKKIQEKQTTQAEQDRLTIVKKGELTRSEIDKQINDLKAASITDMILEQQRITVWGENGCPVPANLTVIGGSKKSLPPFVLGLGGK